MPLDPVLESNTREWLARAEEDLDNAKHDLFANPPFIRSALFHCQQAAEKAMKALLTWHDLAFRKTHNLEELGELCTRVEPSLASAVGKATPLTEYAARFRYPGAPYEPDRAEANESISVARDFIDCILAKLPPEFAGPGRKRNIGA